MNVEDTGPPAHKRHTSPLPRTPPLLPLANAHRAKQGRCDASPTPQMTSGPQTKEMTVIFPPPSATECYPRNVAQRYQSTLAMLLRGF
ncbi:hypothetical protein M413DRAFT_445801 [Hebeloma cylindrosporum]|uniref:Uncharacterized protein n=1 Tax=Hebeloma cylindrosporum TaxID=76867 RepID=A0A0C3BWS2_HEBCY|nr:hypothetical protein M413DRAFT_445801 [Hebeloma cylindrosporum h7]